MFSEAFQKEENHGISSIFIPVHLYATVDIFEMVCLMLIAYNLWFPCWIPEALFLIINWGNPIQSGASRQILSGDGDGDGDEDGDGDRDALSKTKLLKAWGPKAGGALLYYFFFFLFFYFFVSMYRQIHTWYYTGLLHFMWFIPTLPCINWIVDQECHRCTSVTDAPASFDQWLFVFRLEVFISKLKQ